MNPYNNLSAIGAINQQFGDPDQASCAQRQPDVHAAVDRLGRLLEALGGISHAMSERLVPVLRPEPQSGDQKGPGTLKPIGTPLAGRIDTLCDQLEASMNTLGNVIHRLEI
jgi:hypothetical protein